MHYLCVLFIVIIYIYYDYYFKCFTFFVCYYLFRILTQPFLLCTPSTCYIHLDFFCLHYCTNKIEVCVMRVSIIQVYCTVCLMWTILICMICYLLFVFVISPILSSVVLHLVFCWVIFRYILTVCSKLKKINETEIKMMW